MQQSMDAVMTKQTHTVRADATLAQAKELMERYKVRHLPVLHGGQLVGVLSDRDIMAARVIENSDLESLTVEDAATQEVYVAYPDTSLKEVASHMGDRHIGSTVVVDHNDQVVGVFTNTDACRVLGQVLTA